MATQPAWVDPALVSPVPNVAIHDLRWCLDCGHPIASSAANEGKPVILCEPCARR